MKKLITLGLLVATVAFGGTAFAGDGGTLQDIELQNLFGGSQAASTAGTQMAGPGAQGTRSVAPVLEYRGSDIK
jgi:hypothetical protein